MSRELLGTLTARPLRNTSIRVGISGSPGVGKSTFVEALGLYLADAGHRLAVLAVDPSSPLSGGSILGDKTRMEELGRRPEVFIRPSPSSGQLGGVGRAGRETILLCEAAGFDTILVETVGVGQSEVTVKSMTDVFLLLLQPGAGDDLQGIKRGIVEMADILAVNKTDGDLTAAARRTAADYRRAVHLLPAAPNGWTPRVVNISALDRTGIEEIWTLVEKFRTDPALVRYVSGLRVTQRARWLREIVESNLLRSVDPLLKRSDPPTSQTNLYEAAAHLLADFYHHQQRLQPTTPEK